MSLGQDGVEWDGRMEGEEERDGRVGGSGEGVCRSRRKRPEQKAEGILFNGDKKKTCPKRV